MNEMPHREMHRHVGRDMNHEATYEETMVTLEKLGFMRHEENKEPVRSGWYQDSVGGLFHYDGLVWDIVPRHRVQDLEFLGG